MDPKKKKERYERLFEQLQKLLVQSNNHISTMATIASVLHHKMDYFFWTGFYLIRDEKLQIGPYQGSLACIDLKKNTGVCWASVRSKQTIVVPDVHEFAGHIACDARSKSEIVVPLHTATGDVYGVLDVDSSKLNAFDQTDADCLEKIVQLIRFDND